MSTHPLELERLRLDGGTQPRSELVEPTVQAYMDAMERGIEFPPIVACYDGTSYWLVDGFHRVEAAALSGLVTLPAIIHQGTQADAQWMSFGVNAEHGLPRSNADKRRAVEAALRHEKGQSFSDRAIAEHCRVNNRFVGIVRAELGIRCVPYTPDGIRCEPFAPETRTGRDGKSYPVAAKPATPPPPPPADPAPVGEASPSDKPWAQTSYPPERPAPKPVTELPRRPMGEASKCVRNAIHDLVFDQPWEIVARDLAALDRDDDRSNWATEVRMALGHLQVLHTFLQRFAA